jgi:hypothetical protein
MPDDICYCLGIDHAINCPLRPKNTVTISSVASPVCPVPAETLERNFHSTEWQKGYDAGYAAGLAAMRSR